MTLTEFLLARIADDEAAARAVPLLEHNYDMGGNRQDERFTFGRTLPSSADGMGNWSPHRDSPTTRAHFERWEPARVLAECGAKRRIALREQKRIEWHEARGEEWAHEYAVIDLAAVYSDHPDYDEEWRP